MGCNESNRDNLRYLVYKRLPVWKQIHKGEN
jgi:hypothetical protein